MFPKDEKSDLAKRLRAALAASNLNLEPDNIMDKIDPKVFAGLAAQSSTLDAAIARIAQLLRQQKA